MQYISYGSCNVHTCLDFHISVFYYGNTYFRIYITHTKIVPIDFHIRQSVPFHDLWYSSTNYFMARAFKRPFWVIIHKNPMCVARAKCRVCGTVKSEVGQWIRINIGRARLKRNLDLLSVFHCHCPRAQLLAVHTAAHQSKRSAQS